MPLPVGIPSTDPLSVENADLAGSEFAYMGHKKDTPEDAVENFSGDQDAPDGEGFGDDHGRRYGPAASQGAAAGRASVSKCRCFRTKITEIIVKIPWRFGPMPGLFWKLLGRALLMDGGWML